MKPSSITVLILIAFLFLLVGCESDEPTTSETSSENTEETREEEVTVTFAFQPQENPEGLRLDAERFSEFIAQETGYNVEVFLPTSYSVVVEALRYDNADIAYFSGLPYLMAHEASGADILLVEERDGNPFYYSQWYVSADSDYESLADLEGKPIAFTSPTSTSGYLFPMAKVIEEGLVEQGGEPDSFFGEVLFAGGYEQALLALVSGQVEAAAASDYALQQYLTDEQREEVRVLTRQGPVPTHGLAARAGLDEEVRKNIVAALLKLNEEENAELLKSVYGAEKLVPREHEVHVRALRSARDLVHTADAQ